MFEKRFLVMQMLMERYFWMFSENSETSSNKEKPN